MIYFIQLLPVLFAACCAIAALFLRRRHSGGIRRPVYTDAVVISKVTQTGYRHHSTVEQSAPVVRYMTKDGERTATYRRYVPDWQYHYRIGETIPICYDEQNTGIFYICRSGGSNWRSIVLLTVAGATLLAYAVMWVQYYKS